MFVTNWISTTKIQKISEITNFFRHYFLSRTEVYKGLKLVVYRMLTNNTDSELIHKICNVVYRMLTLRYPIGKDVNLNN